MKDVLSDLTPPQREAAMHVDGPLLILAAAGSGKTRVITRRIAYLILQGVPAWQILAITFTNKAAGEMRERVQSLLPARGATICTFHSFCARVLRMHAEMLGLDPNFTIYTTSDTKRTVKKAIERAGLDPSYWTPDKVAERISDLKGKLQKPSSNPQNAFDVISRNVAKIYPIYEELLRENNALDFDDLLMRVAVGLRDNQEFREALQERYRYILIDEYQDTNQAQYMIARLIAEQHQNICATGDPDQAIYGWRGADINNILDFEKDFRGCKVIRLEQNYRSTPQILQAADHLIRFNRKRKEKSLLTANPAGANVTVMEVDTAEEEARIIAEQIRSACPDGKGLSSVAIFYRVNSLSRVLEDELRRHNIAYEIVRGMSFYERQEVRALVGYLRVLVNPRDDLALEQVINTPPRGLGETTLKRVRQFAAYNRLSLLDACRRVEEIKELGSRAVKSMAAFVTMIDDLLELGQSELRLLVSTLIDITRFEDYVQKLSDGTLDRKENVDEFVTLAADFEKQLAEEMPEDEDADLVQTPLMRFLERVSLTSDQDAVHENLERVHLMTLHAAKGLEFEKVFMVALEQGILPHEMAGQDARDIEEERRLCFVGMTRSMQQLTMTYARYRMHRGQTQRQIPSIFLRELGEDGIDRHVSEASFYDSPDEATGYEAQYGNGGYNSANRAGAGGGGWRNGGGKQASGRTTGGQNRSWVPRGDDTRRGYAGQGSAAAGNRSKEVAENRALAGAAASRTGFSQGQIVMHETYGLGSVVEVSGSGGAARITVRFPHSGEKKFVASAARLKIVDGRR